MVFFCGPVSSLWMAAGGMTRAPAAKIRWMIADFSGSPGTIGVAPLRVGLSASSRRSSRIPAIRELLSGPWHRKQVSAIIGRMSRLKLTSARAQAATANARTHAFISSQYTPGDATCVAGIQQLLCFQHILFRRDARRCAGPIIKEMFRVGILLFVCVLGRAQTPEVQAL